MRKNKLLLLLVLLLTAATGAWADETPKVVFEEHFVSEPTDPTAVGFYEFINFEEGDDHEVDNGELSIFNSDGTLDINNWKRRAIKFRNLPLGEGKTYRLEFKLKGSTRFEDGINDGDDRPFCKASAQLLQGVEGHDISLLDSDGNEQRGEFENFDESNYKSYSMTFVFASEQKQKDTYALNNQGELAEKYYLSLSIFNPGYFYLKDVVLYEIPSASSGYTVSLKDGVKDADKWTISPNPAEEGQTVTLQYNGRLKVKGVKATSEAAPAGKTVDLSTLTADYEAQDGETLTGTLAGNYKISIADGATVTLDGVTINGVNDGSYEWAGITCLGDATIILSGTNTVKGFYEDYPGIQAAADKTLIINGTGSLTASNYGWSAGIGGGNGVACGNIEIQGGTITATTGGRVAGIGGGYNASCGNITISGGTVNATGGQYGAGIGGGYNASWGNITISGGIVNATGGEYGAGIGGGKRGAASFSCGNIIISGGTVTATGGNNAPGIGGGRGNNNKTLSSCGDITIANTVTKVTATAGENAPNSIGAGEYGTCGTVTIGGTKYWENNAAVGDGATYLAQSPLIYDPAAPAAKPAATVTTAPTGAAIVGVGKTTELVSGGVADGGTLMYAVTTTNTKPTSTAGFSDAVPTAKDITASGTVYVWYYVKADDTHSDSEIAATAIEVPVADIVWDVTNVGSDIYVDGYGTDPYEKEGVTLSCNDGDIYATWYNSADPTMTGIAFEAYEPGGFTFTAPTGKAFTKIEMKAQGPDGWNEANLGTGWTYNNLTVTWKGSAASTDKLLPDTDNFYGAPVISIVFYLSE